MAHYRNDGENDNGAEYGARPVRPAGELENGEEIEVC